MARRFLLLGQPLKLSPELVKVFALFRKALDREKLEPEPFGLFGLLNEQFRYAWRSHVHLPFLVAVVGGSLGVGRVAFAWPE